MKDTQLREAFRSLVQFLNLRIASKTEFNWDGNYYSVGYETENYPEGQNCNIARKSDISNLQDQIDELKKPKKKFRRK